MGLKLDCIVACAAAISQKVKSGSTVGATAVPGRPHTPITAPGYPQQPAKSPIFEVDAATIREEAGIPAQLRLAGEDEQGGGTAQLLVGGFACDPARLTASGREAVPLLLAHVQAMLDPPDWGPADLFDTATRYELRLFVNDRDVVRGVRRLTGWDRETLVYTPRLVREIRTQVPIGVVAATGSICASICDYRFESPDFVMTATITDRPPPVVPSASLRFLHQTPRGTGTIKALTDDLGYVLADVAGDANARNATRSAPGLRHWYVRARSRRGRHLRGGEPDVRPPGLKASLQHPR